MAIIDDYPAIAAGVARIRGERAVDGDPQLATAPKVRRDSLVVDNGRLRLFPRRTAIQIPSPVVR